MGGRVAGLGCVAILAIGFGVAACGQGVAGDPAPEQTKTAQQKELLPGTNPYPVQNQYTATTFPFPNDTDPYDCRATGDDQLRTGTPAFNGPATQSPAFAAIPVCSTVDANGVADPHVTKYSHWYMWNECQTNDIRCAHAGALFDIGSANGYVYYVYSMGATAAECDARTGIQFPNGMCAQVEHQFYLQSLQRVDVSWSYDPPGGASADGGVDPANTPWLVLNGNAHPPDGNAPFETGDWLQLWNVVSTYSSTGPYKNEGAATVDAKLATCVPVYALVPAPGSECVNGSYEAASLRPGGIIDYFVAADVYDPMGHDW